MAERHEKDTRARADALALVQRWDASGALKTSTYWRLLQVAMEDEPANRDLKGDNHEH